MATYLDHNATTPMAPEVLEAMLPYLRGPYANASSLHRLGRASRDAIEAARAEVAELLGAQPSQVIWTSGGTEANNLAIKGVMHDGGRLLYAATEHPAVMECAESLSDARTQVEAIGVDEGGLIDLDRLRAQLAQSPVTLVSVMAANNETGVIQDVAGLARAVHADAEALFHVDAVQAAGKMAVDVQRMGADLLTVSSHKLYGPKGVGALLRTAPVDLWPLHHGGAQEGGLRGGTENVAAIVGFGAAARLAQTRLDARTVHLQRLRERFEAGLAAIPGVTHFAAQSLRLPNTVQMALQGWAGETLLMALDRQGFCVSSGSACAIGHGAPSHVLVAMGVPDALAIGAIRISFGEANTDDDVDRLLAALTGLARQGAR
ncbi:cysteine desulfurase family protein [Polycyclovorans algicola]|uniref:cysteine desulfurase family protein n=1 Tax=Polycyclovorans algicola TaxID=616992 RepID=UPI0004A782F7|nr:cysteine desulfurase family protein [Polycyclovorans algicola]